MYKHRNIWRWTSYDHSFSNYWDDGNTNNSDGCDLTCQIETGWNCTSGNSTTPSTWLTICGDGKTMSGDNSTDFCDDGNTVDADGCSSSCVIESGYTCTTGNSTTASKCTKDNVMTAAVQSSVAATQSAAGAGAAAAVGVSVLNMSSPNAMWAMANQLQSLMLMVAMSIYLPVSIVQFITANSFMQFSFDFIPLERINLLRISMDWFDAGGFDPKYETIGLKSNSTFNNVISTILCILSCWLVSISVLYVYLSEDLMMIQEN